MSKLERNVDKDKEYGPSTKAEVTGNEHKGIEDNKSKGGQNLEVFVSHTLYLTQPSLVPEDRGTVKGTMTCVVVVVVALFAGFKEGRVVL